MSFLAAGVGAAVSIGTTAYSADQQRKAANKAADMSRNISVSGPFGSVNYGRDGTATYGLNQTGTDFSEMAQRLGLGTLGGYSTDRLGALPYNAGLAATQGNELLTMLGNNDTGLSQQYFGALQRLGADPQSVANDRYQMLRAQAAPGESQAFNTLQSKLFAQGRLGSSGGGVAMKSLFDSQQNADIGRQLAGQDLGLQYQNQLAGLSKTFADSATSRTMDRFNLANQAVASGQQLNAGYVGNAGSLQSLYNDMFSNLLTTQGQGGNTTGAEYVYGAAKDRNNAYANMAGQLAPLAPRAVERFMLPNFTPTATQAV